MALRGRQVPMALTGSLVLLAPMAAQVHLARKVSLANPVLLTRQARQARTAPWELQDRRELQASLGVLGRTVPLEARGSLARLARTVRLVLQGRQAPRARRASQDGVEPMAFQALLVSTVRRASQGLLGRRVSQPTWRSSSWRWVRRRTPWVRS